MQELPEQYMKIWHVILSINLEQANFLILLQKIQIMRCMILVLNYNFPFAPEGYEHKQNKQIQIKFYSSSLDTNPVLGMHIFSFLKRPKSSLDPDLCTKRADLGRLGSEKHHPAKGY